MEPQHTAMARRALLAVAIAAMLLAAIPAAAQSGQRCFPETGHCIAGPIRAYWERNGGLPVFGYPISAQQAETVEDRTIEVQWFERDRLEIQRDGAITAGRLGDRLLELRGIRWEETPIAQNPLGPDCVISPVTSRQMCGPFLRYWQGNGGLERFGYPITEPAEEVIAGRAYTVQYFERRRMELHPELPGSPVLLGLLGSEVYGRTAPALPPEPAGPRPIAGVPADVSLSGVSMFRDTGYAVGGDGSRGYAYRVERAGEGYRAREDGRFDAPLTAVWAAGAAEAWAVSFTGQIYRRGAEGWQPAGAAPAGSTLRTIVVLPGGEVGYAGGSRLRPDAQGRQIVTALLLRLTSEGRWVEVSEVRAPGEVQAISLSGGGAFLVGGGTAEPFAYGLRDGRWSQEDLPNPCGAERCRVQLADVQATVGGGALAAGSYGLECAACPQRALVLERSGGAWRVALAGNLGGSPARSERLLGARMLTLTEGVALAQQSDALSGELRAQLYRYSDGAWRAAASFATPGLLTAVSFGPDGEALAAGAGGLLVSFRHR